MADGRRDHEYHLMISHAQWINRVIFEPRSFNPYSENPYRESFDSVNTRDGKEGWKIFKDAIQHLYGGRGKKN